MTFLRIYFQGLVVGYQDFREFWSARSWLFGWMLRMLTNSFAWVLLGRVTGSEQRVHYLLLGNAVAVGSAAALWASNAVTWARYDGTHPLLVVAPGSSLPAVIGRTSIWLLNGLATSLVTFAVLIPVFQVVPPARAVWGLVPVVIIVCASTYGFALGMGALLSNRSRYRNLALDVCGLLMMAFCGVSVPVTFWPEPVQALAQVLPMTHGLAALRALFDGTDSVVVLRQLGFELVVGLSWLLVSLVTMDWLFNSGRKDGSIELT